MGIFLEKLSLKRSGQIGFWISSGATLIFFIASLCIAPSLWWLWILLIFVFFSASSLFWGIIIYWFAGSWSK